MNVRVATYDSNTVHTGSCSFFNHWENTEQDSNVHPSCTTGTAARYVVAKSLARSCDTYMVLTKRHNNALGIRKHIARILLVFIMYVLIMVGHTTQSAQLEEPTATQCTWILGAACAARPKQYFYQYLSLPFRPIILPIPYDTRVCDSYSCSTWNYYSSKTITLQRGYSDRLYAECAASVFSFNSDRTLSVSLQRESSWWGFGKERVYQQLSIWDTRSRFKHGFNLTCE